MVTKYKLPKITHSLVDSNSPTLGICEVEMSKKTQRATLSIHNLKRVMKIIDGLGWREVSIALNEDSAILFEERKGENKGVAVAPIVNC